MTNEEKELAQRLLLHPSNRWEWYVGMVGSRTSKRQEVQVLVDMWKRGHVASDVLPDITHPATQGWLWKMLTSVSNTIKVRYEQGRFYIYAWPDSSSCGAVGSSESYGIALTECLIDAWKW